QLAEWGDGSACSGAAPRNFSRLRGSDYVCFGSRASVRTPWAASPKVRNAPIATVFHGPGQTTLSAGTGHSLQCNNRLQLFDHLVGAQECRSRQIKAERLGAPQIEDEFEFRGSLDRKITRLSALENLVHEHS